MGKYRYYAVVKGRATGLFDSWPACAAAVQDFPSPRYKGFRDRQERQRADRQQAGGPDDEAADHPERTAAGPSLDEMPQEQETSRESGRGSKTSGQKVKNRP